MSKIRVLLLTNRDSDNVGDQIIEATVISLIKAAYANLDFAPGDFEISTRAAGIVTRAYMKTRDPALLEGARKAISEADVVVFGGAPLFNYSYQNFYLRTIITLELAQEYGVPVLFSSIGVEPFDPNNPKSVALKKALELPVVRQITTRDDFESLAKYVEGTDTPIAHVSDPAVFSDVVFSPKLAAQAAKPAPTLTRRVKSKLRRMARKALRRGTPATHAAAKPQPAAAPAPKQPRIGLLATRAGIFKDNGIDFNEADQRAFWLDVVALLTERGYDYKIFTTGHFSDEAFVDSLVRDQSVRASKCAVTVNSPEELINELKACDGVIAYRLHASITSFAYAIPSIGLSWNFKVPYFYESVGHADRALSHEHWNATEVVD
ncbi:polysaccharide pyruvyl transferase family protein, partial [Demequina sp.]|uniref:polysaccharide pyruvyl transferase family protein n=1 Tax=Demequina sp. TaxID=2050685 RepID=UPI003D1218ED